MPPHGGSVAPGQHQVQVDERLAVADRHVSEPGTDLHVAGADRQVFGTLGIEVPDHPFLEASDHLERGRFDAELTYGRVQPLEEVLPASQADEGRLAVIRRKRLHGLLPVGRVRGGPYPSAVDLSVMQRRTLDGLIRVGSGVEFDPGLRQRLRDRIESGIETVALPVHLRLWKERLNLLARCEGWFMAVSTAQRVPFDHRMDTAAGTLLHKAVELDAWSP